MSEQYVDDPNVSVPPARVELETNLDRPPLISWGAIFGALFFVVSFSWLLYLLGLALGVSIADASDGEAMGNGLGIGATIWIILSFLLVFFVGAILAARLSGKVDSTVGMLHGLVLWGLGTALMLTASYVGIVGLLQTGVSALSATSEAAVDAGTQLLSGSQAAASTIADSPLAENVQARLKRRASSVLANATDGDVKESDVRKAIESLDSQTLEDIAQSIVDDERTSASEALASATSLSKDEANEIVGTASERIQSSLGTDDNGKPLTEDVVNSLQNQLSDYVADFASGDKAPGEQELKNAMEQLSPENLQAIAIRLVQGDVDRAKDYLVNNTDLKRREINAIVDGVYSDVENRIDEFRQTANETIETASTYAQAVLWTVFGAAAMSLVVSILGGLLGAESSRTLYVEEREVQTA